MVLLNDCVGLVGWMDPPHSVLAQGGIQFIHMTKIDKSAQNIAELCLLFTDWSLAASIRFFV